MGGDRIRLDIPGVKNNLADMQRASDKAMQYAVRL
jgi:hypothetical protein